MVLFSHGDGFVDGSLTVVDEFVDGSLTVVDEFVDGFRV